jgi:hypothetical protein
MPSVNQDQLLLELFNGLLNLQDQGHEILQRISAPESGWDIWAKYHIPNILQLLTILVGIGIVIWQVNKQHRSNLETQDEKIRTDLRIQLRADLEKHIQEFGDLTSTAVIFPFSLKWGITSQRLAIENGMTARPLKFRLPEFHERNNSIVSEAIKIICMVEKHLIIAPELAIYKTAMNVFLKDFADVNRQYSKELEDVLPFDVPKESQEHLGFSLIKKPIASVEKQASLDKIGQQYQETLHTVGGWIDDLRVSIQNIALGNLFIGNHVEYRQPVDKSVIVIKTDAESIRRVDYYFEHETAWGKNKREIEAEVRDSMIDSKGKAA